MPAVRTSGDLWNGLTTSTSSRLSCSTASRFSASTAVAIARWAAGRSGSTPPLGGGAAERPIRRPSSVLSASMACIAFAATRSDRASALRQPRTPVPISPAIASAERTMPRVNTKRDLRRRSRRRCSSLAMRSSKCPKSPATSLRTALSRPSRRMSGASGFDGMAVRCQAASTCALSAGGKALKLRV